jgi:AcrR family transcriptional regulator
VVERGFAATRVADVANKLGVSTGLIHYHFDTKDELLAEALAYAARADLARLEAEVAEGTSPLDKLNRVFLLYSPAEAEPGWMLWIDSWGEALRNPALKRISQRLDDAWQTVLEDVIVEGVKDGTFTCADPHATAWRLAAMLDGLGLQVTVHEDVVSRDELLAWVRQAACVELGLPAGAFAAP